MHYIVLQVLEDVLQIRRRIALHLSKFIPAMQFVPPHPKKSLTKSLAFIKRKLLNKIYIIYFSIRSWQDTHTCTGSLTWEILKGSAFPGQIFHTFWKSGPQNTAQVRLQTSSCPDSLATFKSLSMKLLLALLHIRFDPAFMPQVTSVGTTKNGACYPKQA